MLVEADSDWINYLPAPKVRGYGLGALDGLPIPRWGLRRQMDPEQSPSGRRVAGGRGSKGA